MQKEVMYEFEGKWVDRARTYRIWIAHFGSSLGSLAAWTALLDYQSNQITELITWTTTTTISAPMPTS
jgi:hypothetical protein